MWAEEKWSLRSVLWEHYIEIGVFGHLLWRNFVSVLALLGRWPATPLTGEVLKDLGLPDALGSWVKRGW